MIRLSINFPSRLSFAVRAETMALFRQLQAIVRRDWEGGATRQDSPNPTVDDDTLLFEIARRALAGSRLQKAASSPAPSGLKIDQKSVRA